MDKDLCIISILFKTAEWLFDSTMSKALTTMLYQWLLYLLYNLNLKFIF